MGFDAIYAAVSGLQSHQTRINVIGNNIANLNTAGFKAGRAIFQDALVQTYREATGKRGGLAGTNPSQVGLGATVGTIDNVFTQGTIQTTGKNTDLAIEGKGFFALSDGTTRVFTRSGSFSFDDVGRLINPANGFVVQGRVADGTGKLTAELRDITIPFNRESKAESSTYVRLSGNLDSTGGATGAPTWSETTVFGMAATSTATAAPTAASLAADRRLTITVTDNLGKATSGTIKIPGGVYNTASDIDELVTVINSQIDVNGSLKGLVQIKKNTISAGPPAVEGLLFRTVKGGAGVTMKIDDVDAGTLTALGLPNTTPAGGPPPPPNTATTVPGAPLTSTAIDLNLLANVATNLNNGDTIRFTGVKPDGAKFEGRFSYTGAAGGQTLTDLLAEIQRGYGAGVTTLIDSLGRIGLKKTSTNNPITGFTINLSLDDGPTTATSAIFGDKEPFEFNLNSLIYDSKGESHSLTLSFTQRPEANQWTWVSTIDGVTPTEGGAGFATFNADGSMKSFGPADSKLLRFTPAGGAEPIVIDIQASKSGAYAGLTQFATTSSAGIVARDGRGAGRLDTLSVDRGGTIVGRFTNGVSQTLGQIMLADFNNPAGLSKMGNSIFGESDSSGEAIIGIAGETVNGNITSGALELSNVDLSQEFADFIIAQRGFQANARVVTTSDDLMGEIVNLKR